MSGMGLWWKGFVEKVGFESGVENGGVMDRSQNIPRSLTMSKRIRDRSAVRFLSRPRLCA